MKQRDVDVFDRRGRELLNLAIKLEARGKLRATEGQKDHTLISQSRQMTIVALDALIRVVSALLRS